MVRPSEKWFIALIFQVVVGVGGFGVVFACVRLRFANRTYVLAGSLLMMLFGAMGWLDLQSISEQVNGMMNAPQP